MKIFLRCIFLLLFCSNNSNGQIVAWHFYGKTGSESSAAPALANGLLAVTPLVRGGNVIPVAFQDSFGSSNFPVNETKSNALTNNNGLSFTVTPITGFACSFNSLQFKFIRDASAPKMFAWYYSVDGTNFIQVGSDISYTGTTTTDSKGSVQTSVDLTTASVFQSVVPGTVVTFKLICWGATSTSGKFALGASQFISGNEEQVLQLFGGVTAYCPPPEIPNGTISGTTPTCGNTSLTYTGAPPSGEINYWETSTTGTSTTNNAASPLAVTASGSYYVRARNSSGCWSDSLGPYAVVINSTPTISSNPTSAYVADTQNTSFTVTATNATAYQWQLDAGSGFTDITTGGIYGTSPTTATLTITGAITSLNGYKYRCVVKADPCTSVASASAVLYVGQLCLSEGFDNGTSPPTGWVFTGFGAMQTYTAAGDYGIASPSLKMTSTGDAIETPVVTNMAQFSFWMRGKNTNGKNSTVTVQVSPDGTAWTTIETIGPNIPTTAETKTYNSGTSPALPANTKKIKIYYTRDGGGNVAFDDVSVLCASLPVVTASSFSGTVGIAFSNTLSVTNQPITSFAIVSGSLPGGLSMNTATGTIMGTPTVTGTFAIDVTATNPDGTSAPATVTFTISSNELLGYFRSKTSGIWNAASTWESSQDNSTWNAATVVPNEQSNTIWIQNGHTVTLDSSTTLDQVVVKGNLTVSGTSVSVTVNNGTGGDIIVNTGGLLTLSSGISGGWLINSGATISILSGATYTHNSTSDVTGFLNAALLDSNSTFIFKGSNSLTPSVSLANRNFGHLRFESSFGSLTIAADNTASICSSNDFYIGANVIFSSVNLTSNSLFSVRGNFSGNGTMNNAAGYFNFDFTGISKTISGTIIPNFDTVNVTGSYTMDTGINMSKVTSSLNIYSSGILDNGGENQLTGNGIVTVGGKFITHDAQGFNGSNAAIPTMSTTMNTGSVVEYAGDNQILTMADYYDLIISGTGVKTIQSSNEILVNNELSVISSTLQIDNNKSVTVTNAIKNTSGNDILVLNGGNLVQITDVDNEAANTNIGNIKMTRITRSLKKYDYIYWGSPVKENVISQIPAVFDARYIWNLNGTYNGSWVSPASIVPAQGFITRLSSATTGTDFNFTGKPNNGIVKTFGNSYDNGATPSATGNSVLLGNPYPSAIDAEKFVTDPANFGKIGGTLYFWTSLTPLVGNAYTANDYATWNGTGSTAASDTSMTDNLKPTGKIASGQGFFAKLLSDYDVTFNNSMRVRTSTANNQFFKTINPVAGNQEKHRIWLNLKSGDKILRQMLVGYVSGATNDYDNLYDGPSLTNNQNDIYSLNDSDFLVIQGRGLPFDITDKVPLGYKTAYTGSYSIEIDLLDGLFKGEQSVYLEDKLLNTIHDLKSSAYFFDSEPGEFNKRFVLRYTDETLSLPNNNSNDKDMVSIFAQNGKLTICSSLLPISQLMVFDLRGRLLFKADDIDNLNYNTSEIVSSRQVVIVKIQLNNGGHFSKKIIFDEK